MGDIEFLDLVMRYLDGALSPEERAGLQQELASEPGRRLLFAETLVHTAALQELFRRDAVRMPEVMPKRSWSEWLARRPWIAAAMLLLGVLVGMVGSGVVWAMASSRLVVATEKVAGLVDGGFETLLGPLPVAFPNHVGVWSGDSSEVVSGGAMQGKRRLRFMKAEADAATPQQRPIACDLFQLVDLRGLRRPGHEYGDVVLELSAEFLDERPANSNPSVTFFCQLFLFRGEPTDLHESWPLTIGDAVGSGSAETTTLGDSGWRTVAAKCLISHDADFAVVHLAARPNLRGPMPSNLFADDVMLTLRTQPLLPVDVAKR